jgi:hypothetical protein
MNAEILTTRVADRIAGITWAAQGAYADEEMGDPLTEALDGSQPFPVRLKTQSRSGLPMFGDRFPD